LLGNVKLTSDEKHTLKSRGHFVRTAYEQPDRKFIIGEKYLTEINTSYGGNHLNRQYLDIKNYYFSGLAEYNLKFDEKKTENQIV
jgi:hypothetical protein